MAETYVYFDQNGTSHDLSLSGGSRYPRGLDGRFMPPVTIYSDPMPQQHGNVFRGTRIEPRTVTLLLSVLAGGKSALRALLRSLSTSANPTISDDATGVLRITTEDAVTRDLNCVYSGGIENESDAHPTLHKFALSFYAADPFWYDSSDTQLNYELDDTSEFFPFTFPFVLAGSTIFASASIDNQGDVEAFPTWEITGPGDDIVLRNFTTDKTLSLVGYSLPTGGTISITTAPGQTSITREDGTNLFPELVSGGMDLWSLAKGSNSIQVEMSNADADVSGVTLSYKARYLAI